MLYNFWKVALRNLAKNKSYVLISTLGMGIAIACALTGYLLIAYNLEFDDFFDDKQVGNIVKVVHTYETSDKSQKRELESPMAIAPRIMEDIGGIEDKTRFCNHNVITSHNTDAFYENIRFADASFFNMFGLTVDEGSTTSFDDLYTIILSQELATKYFGEESPIGKALTVEINEKKFEVIVGGVLSPIPLNTSFNIHALMRMEVFVEAYDIKPDDWNSRHTSTLLLKLSDIEGRSKIEEQMHMYSRLMNAGSPPLTSISYELVPFKQTIGRDDVSESELRMPIPNIALIIFSSLGGMILLIACFNLTNTTLAMTARRMKEIGIRKVVGSAKRLIAVQLTFEVLIMVVIAIVAACAMSTMIVPRFAEMWDLQYGLTDLNGTNVLLTVLLLLFVISIIAGLYPAIYNSRFNAVALLKGAKTKGTSFLSKALLTGQFALSAIVLIGGITFTQNAAYQAQLDFGYDFENLLVLSTGDQQNFNRIRDAVSRNSSVVATSGAENGIGPFSARYVTAKIDTTSFKTDMHVIGADYMGTVGMNVLEGREFTEGEGDLESILVDENFVDNHGLERPLGTEITVEEKKYRVIGVVSNHVAGLKQEDNTEYIFLAGAPGSYSTLFIHTLPGQSEVVRKDLGKIWKQLVPDKPFLCETQHEILYQDADAYNSNLKDIFFFLTLLGSLLAASGIYASASLNANKQKKEIGIRKVMGASVGGIVQLLNKEFAVVLLSAVVIGGASGYFLTNALLASLYKQFTGVGALSLVVSLGIVVVIGLAVTSSVIVRAAITNPVNSLKE
jgi:ABC-type antimicrobial peptide transport system permease subunit